MNNIPILLDVDTGTDDAYAICYAYYSNILNIVGITTTGGNTNLEQVSKNTIYTAQNILRTNIPIGVGSRTSLTSDFIGAEFYHGPNGLGGVLYDLNKINISRCVPALEQIKKCTDQYNEITIVCLGPATNIARYIQQHGTKSLKNIFIMGGAVKIPGNITQYAEFNMFQDPKAFEILLKSKIPLYIIPLDITNQMYLTLNNLYEIRIKSSIGNFLFDITQFWRNTFSNVRPGFTLWDPVTVAAVKFPDIISYKKTKILVNADVTSEKRGQIYESSSGYTAFIGTRCNNKRVLTDIMTCLTLN